MFFLGVVILDCINDIHQQRLCTKPQEVKVFIFQYIIPRLVEMRFFAHFRLAQA